MGKKQQKTPLKSFSEIKLPVKPEEKPKPAREQIEKRAYQIYLARGCAPGKEAEDWIQAEKELLEEIAK